MSRFIRPDTATLTLANGDTLLVKRRLNNGEQRAAFARMYHAGATGALTVNPLQTGMAVVTAYLLDWSLRDDAGQPVVIRDQPIDVVTSALDALDPDSFTEIKDAIETHDRAMTAERDAQKKIPGGATASDLILPSPSALASPSTPSEASTSTSTTS